ncbi:hypothetical protein BDZ91DRAFT_720477 [Kalaharituber pfeilii]|nr:hypothetical protein BDZ91DRAFT_720477 [Kalaharituber pfeilii]
MASVKIFVECDPDVRLARRVIRDSTERNLSLEHIFDQYVRFGKPAAEIAIQPTKVLADIILPRGAEGPGIELIAHGVLDDLKQLKGKKAGPGHTLALYPTTTTTTLKEADLVGTTSSLAYYETV